MTTFLDLVNNVLARLREQQVVIVTQNAYSILISQLINDAKREVENAWDWDVLRTSITVQTVPGTSVYTIPDSGRYARILHVYDNTNKTALRPRSRTYMIENINLAENPVQNIPNCFSVSGADTNGNVQIELYPVPSGEYDIVFDIIKPEADLVENEDITVLPKAPLVALAWAKAIEERGEDGGVNISSQYAVAKQALGDAIAIEAHRRPEDITWYSH